MIGGIISGVGGLLGGIASSVSNAISVRRTNQMNAALQRETNAMNWQMNQLNNQFNAEEARKQRAHEQSMFDQTNEYNSAAQQRLRLQQAGLNPYLMMSGGSAGTASSNTGSSAASAANPVPMSAPHVQAPQFDYGSITSGLANVMGALNSLGDFKLKDIDSQTRGRTNLAAIQELTSRAQLNAGDTNWFNASQKARRYGLDNGGVWSKIQLETNRQGLDNLRYQGTLMQADFSLRLLDGQAKSILNKYLDSQQQADLAVRSATMFQLFAEGKKSLEQVRTEIARQGLMWNQASTEWTRNKQMKLDYRVNSYIADSMVKALIEEYGLAADDAKARRKYVDMTREYEALLRRRTYRTMPFNTAIDALGAVGGAIGAIKGTGITPYTFRQASLGDRTRSGPGSYNGRPNY